MNRGTLLSILSVAGIGVAQAHVSHAHGTAHAFEHLWLLLALLPAGLLLRPLVLRLIRSSKR